MQQSERVSISALLACITCQWQLVSDIRREPRSAARAGHDIAGQGLHLDLRTRIAQVRSTAGPGTQAVCGQDWQWHLSQARLRYTCRLLLASWLVEVQ